MSCKVKTGVSVLRAFHREKERTLLYCNAEIEQDISLLGILSHGLYFTFKIEMCFVSFSI